jgi:hypothetical protein
VPSGICATRAARAARADFRRTVGEKNLALVRRHRQQLPEKIHGRFSARSK